MLTQALFRALDKKAVWVIGIFLAVAIYVPVANLLIPPGQFGHVPTYLVSLGKYLSYAILALALDLVWGYCGILSLGHSAFFALGGLCHGHVSLCARSAPAASMAIRRCQTSWCSSIGRSCLGTGWALIISGLPWPWSSWCPAFSLFILGFFEVLN